MSEQGCYVIYRLFQKQVDKTESSILEEMDRSGYSLPLLTTWKQTRKLSLLNKESLESGLHGCPIELPGTIETLGAPVTRLLADRNGNSGTDEVNVLSMPFRGNVDESLNVRRTLYVQSLKVNSGPHNNL